MYRNDIEDMTEKERNDLLEVNGYDRLEEAEHDEVCDLLNIEFDCVEADILDDIYNGKWTEGAKRMLTSGVEPTNLIDYIQAIRDEEGREAYEWFSLPHAVSITEVYHSERIK